LSSLSRLTERFPNLSMVHTSSRGPITIGGGSTPPRRVRTATVGARGAPYPRVLNVGVDAAWDQKVKRECNICRKADNWCDECQ
jgi:hypothetical protein